MLLVYIVVAQGVLSLGAGVLSSGSVVLNGAIMVFIGGAGVLATVQRVFSGVARGWCLVIVHGCLY